MAGHVMGWDTFMALLASQLPANHTVTPREVTDRERRDAIAMMVYRFCAEREWDCALSDIAEGLDLPLKTVRSVCASRGLTRHLRTMSTDRRGSACNAPDLAPETDDVPDLIGFAA